MRFLTRSLLMVSFVMLVISSTASAESLRFYIGTYTKGESKGIYQSTLDTATGKLSTPKLVAETPDPSFLALSKDGKTLVAVNELSEYKGEKSGSVTSFSVTEDGKLTSLSTQSTHGGWPCHLEISPNGRRVYVANYGGGNLAVLPLRKTGKLGQASMIQHEGKSVNPNRQESPHAHAVYTDPSGKYVLAADLGIDQVLVYQWDKEKKTLVANDPAHVKITPGSGPRHLAFNKNGKRVYVLNEILSTIELHQFSADGKLTKVQSVSTLPADFSGNSSTAEIHMHASGKWLYSSNRGHNSIAIFKVNAKSGELTLIDNQSTEGETPRQFMIDPTGQYLLAANQGTSNIAVLKIDQKTGKLSSTGQQINVPMPVCVLFAPQK